MRAVMALSSTQAQGACSPDWAEDRPASADDVPARCRVMETRQREGFFTRRCCLGLEREGPFRTAGKNETSLFGVDRWRADET